VDRSSGLGGDEAEDGNERFSRLVGSSVCPIYYERCSSELITDRPCLYIFNMSIAHDDPNSRGYCIE
jgi:hypothetical protein